MLFAVNFSVACAELVRSGRISLDRFKCPAWPEHVAEVQRQHPVYVHFPLRVGSGHGVLNTETGGPPDWAGIESLLAGTTTPHVNVHLSSIASDCQDMPLATRDPAHARRVAEAMLGDLEPLVARFGAGRVVAENAPFVPAVDTGPNAIVRPAVLPQVIRQVVEEAGCGLLLDLAHARLSAIALDMDPREYVSRLPVERIREIHVTGVQLLAGRWLDLLNEAGVAESDMPSGSGVLMDHLPLTGPDWELADWAMGEIRAGRWSEPWVVTFEYGGTGPYWKALTEPEVLLSQVPRLARLVHGSANGRHG